MEQVLLLDLPCNFSNLERFVPPLALVQCSGRGGEAIVLVGDVVFLCTGRLLTGEDMTKSRQSSEGLGNALLLVFGSCHQQVSS